MKIHPKYWIVIVLLSLLVMWPAPQPSAAAGPWYVATSGDDSNDCQAPGTACASINAVLAKPGFLPGDTVLVASGTYTGSGSTIVVIDKDVTLSGGWDDTFSIQNGASIIDGENARRGLTASAYSSESTVIIERFTIRNGSAEFGAGILNYWELHLTNSTVSGNSATGSGGGIYSYGEMTLNNVTVSDNEADSDNDESGDGGGIKYHSGTITLQNSIVADNAASAAADCSGSINSAGYNLIDETDGCTFTASTGDQTDLDAGLGPMIGPLWYHPLIADSPAIDVGNPTGCADNFANPLPTDQRGVSRVGVCDSGAFEYSTPTSPDTTLGMSVTPQRAPLNNVFASRFQVFVLDAYGSPVNDTGVTLTAPTSGASGTFADSGTNTTTTQTNEYGFATAAVFTANDVAGSYVVSAEVGATTPVEFELTNTSWYVSTTGDDANDCQSALTPCASINAVLDKIDFADGDTVFVASGTYTSTVDEVVLLDRDVVLLGGWDGSFAIQNGRTVLDGERTRRGLKVETGVVAIAERFNVLNGFTSGDGGGIHNRGSLTLSQCDIRNNASADEGGGIYTSYGVLTMNNCAIDSNRSADRGGGMFKVGTGVILNNSTVSSNTAAVRGGGINNYSGTMYLNNSTVSNNTAQNGGGLFIWSGGVWLNSSTVSSNKAAYEGGGIRGGFTLKNSIIASNTAGIGPDCYASFTSSGYNLLGDTSNCNFTPAAGDLADVDADLGLLIGASGSPLYQPLLAGSPAIDAGNPAGCTDQNSDPLETDQRGAARVGTCDIGAYEYTDPGLAATISAVAGSPQRTLPSTQFPTLFHAAVLDSIGSPIADALVTFTAPTSGPSGIFLDSSNHTTSGSTNAGGVVAAAPFIANDQAGAYLVSASTAGVATPAMFLLNNTGWYVAPGGDDADDCQTPSSPCATINGVLGKAGFLSGDTILAREGTYVGTGNEVVLLNTSARLLGGWDDTFTSQDGYSVVDGEEARRGLSVTGDVTATIERFRFQNGFTGSGGGIENRGFLYLSNCGVDNNAATYSGGIYNRNGYLELLNCSVSNNAATGSWESRAGGIANWIGTTILDSSSVYGNTSDGEVGGLYNDGLMILNNSTVSDNHAASNGGGFRNDGTLRLNSSTITENTASSWGGGIYRYEGNVVLRNTILQGNLAGLGPNCMSSSGVESEGYNLIGDPYKCSFVAGTGDLMSLGGNLGALIGASGNPLYNPLMSGSPAIDAGNPAGCLDHEGSPISTDQRGAARVGTCDIGAYEYTTPGSAATITALSGTPQTTAPLSAFGTSLQAVVLDGIGSPVSAATVTFTAPGSGPSGIFSDSSSNTTAATTGENGIAEAAEFTANDQGGGYVIAAVAGGVVDTANFELDNGGWYLSPSGNDSNDCDTASSPCVSVSGVLGKAGFLDEDTVLVGAGTYTGTGTEVVLLDRSTRLVGGWNDVFTAQIGVSTLDGEGSRRGITVSTPTTAIVEDLAIQNGYAGSGGGLYISGNLTLIGSIVRDNFGDDVGGGTVH